ncbi:MAG TPA: IclR family transcriptional regulator [Candidatus Limnocylindria bacterium]|nr:IclR family transcriptional regulator [Candidatus Limnocylindria bacterium]
MLDTVNDALRVLELLGEHGKIAVKDIATELRCSRSSAYRIVRTLQDRGWMVEARFGTYELGPRATALGLLAAARPSLRDVALPVMRKLVERFDETVTLSVLLGRERVCIDQIESPKEIRMTVRIGQPYPLYAGGSGKAILMALADDLRAAYLRDVPRRRLTPNTLVERRALERSLAENRARGYVVSVAERDPEAFAVAAPIVDRNGVVGAIALCGPVSRWQAASAERYGPAVRDAAAQISAQLGATAEPGRRRRATSP